MTREALLQFFLWCGVVNYAILLAWFLVFASARDWLRRLHGRWFRIPEEQFDAIHYQAMAYYKLGIFLLNLAPWIALRIAG